MNAIPLLLGLATSLSIQKIQLTPTYNKIPIPASFLLYQSYPLFVNQFPSLTLPPTFNNPLLDKDFTYKEFGFFFTTHVESSVPIFEKLDDLEEARLGNSGIKKSTVGYLKMYGKCRIGCAIVTLQKLTVTKLTGETAFPAALSEVIADPFLMCDYFGPSKSSFFASNPDEFPIRWHPHVGMDICTYLKQGVGRHADSLGNRGTFSTPGMQWISVGNGIEHAEGGGTPIGETEEGFQLWFNTPSSFKSKPPKYGTVDTKDLPVVQIPCGSATLLAGSFGDMVGPFDTVQPIQVIDFEFDRVGTFSHSVPDNLDNVVIFVYAGTGKICGSDVEKFSVLHLDAKTKARDIQISSIGPLKFMLFAGKSINEKIAWHGPFVMNSQLEITKVLESYRSGNFPPVRTKWDYRKIDEFPK